jgi:hypothetical protein
LYRYSYPSDCLVAREILQTTVAGDPIAFEVALGDAYNSLVILTDLEAATLIYTHKVTNPLVFDPLFVQALAWRLAGELSMPLTRDSKRMEAAYQMYNGTLAEAFKLNANESHLPTSREADWITGRA